MVARSYLKPGEAAQKPVCVELFLSRHGVIHGLCNTYLKDGSTDRELTHLPCPQVRLHTCICTHTMQLN